MATISVSVTSSSITVTIDELDYYEYNRKFYIYVYDEDDNQVAFLTDTIDPTLMTSTSVSYDFDGLDAGTTYSIEVFIFGNDSGSYAQLAVLSATATTAEADVEPEITDVEASYSSGTVTIDVTIYCSSKSFEYYVIVASGRSSSSTIYDVRVSSSRSKYSTTISISFSYTISGSERFYVLVSSSDDPSDYYDYQRITIEGNTRQYFSWDSSSLLDDAPDDDEPIQAGDALSDYLTVKKWTLLQDCVNDVYYSNSGATYDFTTVTTSTVVSADIYNEMRSALSAAGCTKTYLPSTVSSGDAITAEVFNDLQTACNSIDV